MNQLFVTLCLFASLGAAIVQDGCRSRIVFVTTDVPIDSMAERMLRYQRSNGGWPQPGGNAINYKNPLSPELEKKLAAERWKQDATIDDQATTREINYLVTVFAKTQNPAYLAAAERGISYLLSAQNRAGGWPQFYPDTTGYRKQITYNDQSMMDVVWVMEYTATGTNGFGVVNQKLAGRAKEAVERGVQCILKTQYRQRGKLTAWCAQHDRYTLLPVKARAFELPSLSGNESVGIVEFLMHIDNPSPAVKQAIEAAVTWLDSVKITGMAVKDISDPTQPSGRDRVAVPEAGSIIWARFYDLDTNTPFFSGRNSMKVNTLAEIENERRVGYAWYGTWPARLLAKDYPNWVKKWGKP